MPSIAHPTWLVVGLILLGLGFWLWRWSARHAIDLKAAALDAAWQGARGGKLAIPADLQSKYDAIAAEKGNVRRAAKAGGTVVRHLLARIAGLAGLISMVGGLGLAAAGIWWS
jgi:hypothetical protein